MKAPLVALLAGLLFGAGLIVSGMADPGKVHGFLDLAGPWDPSLALVMVGAIAVAGLGFAVARRRGQTMLGHEFHHPGKRGIDARLVLGAALFGLGWGLVGICPGPGLVLLGAGFAKAAVFCVAMVAGMLLHTKIEH